MQDRFSRPITYLRLSVTDRCNYRCAYCMPAEGVDKLAHTEVCSFEELTEMTAAAVACGIRKVRVTGGEPLVRKDVPTLCRAIRAIDGVEELCLTTNGSLLSVYAAALKDAGVDRLNVSLDTLDPERYAGITRGGVLQQVFDGMEAAVRAGFPYPKLNVVLMGGVNDDQIASFLALTRDKPVEVRFLELMPVGQCAAWDKNRFLSTDAVLERFPALAPVSDAGTARLYRLPGHAGTVGLISPLSHRFCNTCDRIRITADGRLKPCLHSDREIPLRGFHGEELVQRVAQGIAEKPACHDLIHAGESATHRNMNAIGG